MNQTIPHVILKAKKRKYEESLQTSVKAQKLEPEVKNVIFEPKFHSEEKFEKSEANASPNVIKWDESDQSVKVPECTEPKKKTVILRKMFGNKNIKNIPPQSVEVAANVAVEFQSDNRTEPSPPLAIKQCPALPLDEPNDTSRDSKVDNPIQNDVNWTELMVKKEVIYQNEISLRHDHAKIRNRKDEPRLREIISITHKQKIIEKQKENIQQAENILALKCDPGYVPATVQPTPVGSKELIEPVSNGDSADSLPDLVPIIDESEKDGPDSGPNLDRGPAIHGPENVEDPNDKIVAGLLNQVTVITKTEIQSEPIKRVEPIEDHSDAMHFEDFLTEQFGVEDQEPNDDDIEQFGDVTLNAEKNPTHNSSVLDILNSRTLEDDDVTFISKDMFGSMIEPSYIEAQKNMKFETVDETSNLENDLDADARCSVCGYISDGAAVQCENKNNCVSERGWFHFQCTDFEEWQNELIKEVEKDLKIKKKSKEIEKLNKVERFINDCKKEYLNEDLYNKQTIFDKHRWEWKTKYPYFCPSCRVKPEPKRKLEIYQNLHKDKLVKFLKQLKKYRVAELEKIARRKKNLTKESEVKCPIKKCKAKFYLLPIDKKMRRKMKIEVEHYEQVGDKKQKVEVYGSVRLCRHIEEDHTVAEIGKLVEKEVDSEISDRKLASLSEHELEKYMSDWTVHTCSFCKDKNWATQDGHIASTFFFKPKTHLKEHQRKNETDAETKEQIFKEWFKTFKELDD